MSTGVRVLGAEHEGAFASLWQAANDERRRRLAIVAKASSDPALSRVNAFGVGVVEGDSLVAAAVGIPARADDGRSERRVAGLAHISSVATQPNRWGEGLGGDVVRALMWHAVYLGYARVQLWTHASNWGAQRLYEREGFTLSGRQKADDYGEPIVHYIRELPTPRLVLGRQAARVLCLDSNDRVLLMHWRHPVTGHQLWEPPGGGIEPGETPRDAVLREWREETGLPAPPLAPEPTTVSRDVLWGDARFIGDEVFFLGRYDAGAAGVAVTLTSGEQTSYLGQEWVHWRDLTAGKWRGDLVDPDLLPVLRRLDPTGPWTEQPPEVSDCGVAVTT
ncbi:MAG: GNAT family N-acetyltransferase [Nocardioidaceae bacterium]